MLTKVHRPKPVGRPIISGCNGPTERISAFVDKLIQPIAKIQNSYIRDITDFINFTEREKLPDNTLLVAMDVTCLYTNILQEQGMQIVCAAYDKFYINNPPIPTRCLRKILRLILEENSFKLTNKLYLQCHRTAMGTKAAAAFANIFMAEIQTQIFRQSKHKPLKWIRYIDDTTSLWVTTDMKSYNSFRKQTNSTQQSNLRLKYQGMILLFLDTTIYKGERLTETGIGRHP